ncbi:glycosyltransferase [Alteribacillus bidgolensis]|uniref:Glycosyltransferase, GT2 family n=1 Tax=Alteribacillus bidgolensis TaxID=930129 RepID=A0A1G8I1U3_9BACI|nr:glycosyltransferase [Alteribacillus bidgolensis]SDI12772.1 Glycosyltransferase, GT2 family [Alteribacillus bidgolensis]
MNIKVSIIIPFYNCPFIGQAIYSALNQTYSNIEVIVVNDGSTIHQSNIHKIRKMKPFRYFEKRNGGAASALNMGIKNATGKYIAWLSSDDLFERSKIEKQVLFMQQRNLSISHTNYSIINKAGSITNPRAGTSYAHRKIFSKNLLKTCFINGCTVMMRADIFKKIGFFDEKLIYAHDYDFWLRAVQYYTFGYINQPLTRYRYHEGMGSVKNNTALVQEANRIRTKYSPIIKNFFNKR